MFLQKLKVLYSLTIHEQLKVFSKQSGGYDCSALCAVDKYTTQREV